MPTDVTPAPRCKHTPKTGHISTREPSASFKSKKATLCVWDTFLKAPWLYMKSSKIQGWTKCPGKLAVGYSHESSPPIPEYQSRRCKRCLRSYDSHPSLLCIQRRPVSTDRYKVSACVKSSISSLGFQVAELLPRPCKLPWTQLQPTKVFPSSLFRLPLQELGAHNTLALAEKESMFPRVRLICLYGYVVLASPVWAEGTANL